MAVDTRYDAERKILHLTLKDAPTAEQFLAAMQMITTSDQFPPDVDTLWDFRETDLKDLNREIILRLIEIRKQHPKRAEARVAFVGTDDFKFGMLRMFELSAVALPNRMMVFRTCAEAEQWLLDR